MNKNDVQLTNPEEYSRCGEHDQAGGISQNDRHIQEMDMAMDRKINHALWKDEVLRATDIGAFEIHVKNSIVYMSGHLNGSTNHQRVQKALRTVDGIEGVRSTLVMDDDLLKQVATSLGQLEHSYHCKFFTGVLNGVVILNGEVGSRDVSKRAEQEIAGNSRVRGVINVLRIPGVDSSEQDDRFLQPAIGKEIIFRDGASGIVRQVVIDPDNRRVIAMIIQGQFFQSQQHPTLAQNSRSPIPEQMLVIPVSTVGYLTNNSGFLTIPSTDTAKFQEYDSSLFAAPENDWVPPYPYCIEDVFFPAERQLSMNEQGIANDSLGG
jgi:osmotically-inducible protein OsmY